MVILQEGKYTDVVFVIEGNASLGAYFDELKGNYILPTLVHFNGGPLIDSDFTGDYEKTVFSLVVFNSVDCFPGPAISCTTPTSNAKEFMRTLDKILFIGGGGESHSLLAEGLGGAMQIFDHMKIRREARTKIDKMCILITNSPPFSIPAMECGHYSGYTAEQLAVLMGERNVNLSIMSPRKLGVLQRLYDKSCAELQVVPSKDYAKDERHLILLKGFELQERVPESKESIKQVPGNASPRRTLPSGGMKNSPGQSPNTKFKVPTTQSIASQGQGGAPGKFCTLC
ncbi:mediator of RNA polymerase II transcription subunit 25 [Strongylocentrotus purpuratus]|uniref:Mediator of RNA polymerase II transcription subunit 25 n=1 Tax=Strongylocentrotus purpuratus TaxID=7668 RepID=A0A7M7P8M6_STRPU|nr:mediator of RNA polymerase II transcription subunit 25 [Strongylocentrotus purpuratus]